MEVCPDSWEERQRRVAEGAVTLADFRAALAGDALSDEILSKVPALCTACEGVLVEGPLVEQATATVVACLTFRQDGAVTRAAGQLASLMPNSSDEAAELARTHAIARAAEAQLVCHSLEALRRPLNRAHQPPRQWIKH